VKRRQPLFSFVAQAREVVSNRATQLQRLNDRSHGDSHPLQSQRGCPRFCVIKLENNWEEHINEQGYTMLNHTAASQDAGKRAWIYIRIPHNHEPRFDSLEKDLRAYAGEQEFSLMGFSIDFNSRNGGRGMAQMLQAAKKMHSMFCSSGVWISSTLLCL
jgi:hypothetical protein